MDALLIINSSKRLNTLVLVFLFLTSYSQNKFTIQKGEINFASNANLELIKASSDKVNGILDPATSLFAFSVPVSAFRGFNSDLQRQHFNENYMESDKFPKATFSGKIIEHISYDKDSAYTIRAKGDLDIHGVKQNRIIKSKMIVKNGTIRIESDFVVPLADHNISIPKIVNQKIANEIEVSFRANLVRQ
jgi:hypothetical protein